MLTEPGTSTHKLWRFKKELELLRAIASPAVIRAHGIERHGDQVAMVLEDAGGDALSCGATQRLPLVERVAIGVRIAAALADVHAAGVVHRDIKPDNIVYVPATRHDRLIDSAASPAARRPAAPAVPARARWPTCRPSRPGA